MDFYIHYTTLPEGLHLEDVVEELNQLLDDTGVVNGGLTLEKGGRIDLDLEEEKVNPKHAQVAIKNYLQQANFPRDTTVEFGCMEIGIYE